VLGQFLLRASRLGGRPPLGGDGIFAGSLGQEQRRFECADSFVGAPRERSALANAIEHGTANSIVGEPAKRNAASLIEATSRLEQTLVTHGAEIIELDRATELACELPRHDLDQLEVCVKAGKNLGGVLGSGHWVGSASARRLRRPFGTRLGSYLSRPP